MIELLIDWLDEEIKRSEAMLLNGMIADIVVYRMTQTKYQTLVAIREKAAQLAARGEEDDR